MSITAVIIEKIKTEGPIPFRDYMEMALYHPEYGYYNTDKEKIGKNGDYFTSPWFTSIFGELIAKQLEEMWILLNRQPFTILEYGAGTGLMCRDILAQLKSNSAMYEKLNYCIVEQSAVMRKKEKELLTEKVSWYNSIAEVPPVNGCILSNEVIDNFPVHQVLMQDELMEIFVDYKNDFTEILRPASPPLKAYFDQLNIDLPKGFRAEVNLQVIEWIKEIAAALNKGFVLTIDYGYDAMELYDPKKRRGTLLCYYKHQVSDRLYDNIGGQDITAHVNFSAMRYWGSQYGLACAGFCSQAKFLHALGLTSHLADKERKSANNTFIADHPAITMLRTFLGMMGSKLKVLMQLKGINAKPSSMMFSERLF